MATIDAPTTTGAAPDITLYWLDYSRAHRIVWLLEELKQPYKVEKFYRVNGLAPPEAQKIHPLGKFPMVKVDGRVLADSGFITEVLIDRYAPWLKPDPADEEETLRYKYFLHYAEGSFMGPLVLGVVLSSMVNKSPYLVRPLVRLIVGGVNESFLFPNYKLHLDFLEGELKDRAFLCAEKLTGTDIVLTYALLIGKDKIHGFTEEAYPRLYAYTARIEALEGYQRAMKKTEGWDGPGSPF